MVSLIPSEHFEYRAVDFLRGMTAALHSRERATMLYVPGLGDCIPARSARGAIVAAIQALDLPSGARIGVPLYCCPVVFKAVQEAGCTARFIDVEYSTYCMSGDDLFAKRDQVDAIIAVHMFGNLCDMSRLQEAARGKPIIEDCAQSLGSRYHGRPSGTLGTIGVFSFRSGKYVSAGEGGALFTGDEGLRSRLAQAVSAMPAPDRKEECVHVVSTFLRSILRRRPLYGLLGYRIWAVYNKNTDYSAKSPIVMSKIFNSDLVMTKRRMAYLETAIEKQRDHADYYSRSLRLDPEMLCFEKPGMYYNRYLYPITFPAAMQRDSILAYLLNREIGAILPYTDIVDIAAKYYGYEGDCPIAEQISRRVLVIPNNHSLGREDVQRIAGCLNEVWEKVGD